MRKKNEHTTPGLIRSSAAEDLTFIAATGDQEQATILRYEDETMWLTQKMPVMSCMTRIPAIMRCPKSAFGGSALTEASVVKCHLTTADNRKNLRVRHSVRQAMDDVP